MFGGTGISKARVTQTSHCCYYYSYFMKHLYEVPLIFLVLYRKQKEMQSLPDVLMLSQWTVLICKISERYILSRERFFSVHFYSSRACTPICLRPWLCPAHALPQQELQATSTFHKSLVLIFWKECAFNRLKPHRHKINHPKWKKPANLNSFKYKSTQLCYILIVILPKWFI